MFILALCLQRYFENGQPKAFFPISKLKGTSMELCTQQCSSCTGLLAEVPPACLKADLCNCSAWIIIQTSKSSAAEANCIVLNTTPTFCPRAEKNQN